MKKLISRLLIGAIFIGVPVWAFADYTIKDSGSTTRTILAFVCVSTKICPAQVLIKSDGTEIGTTSNPVYFDTPAGGNLYGGVTGAVPVLNATAYNTNSYSNAGTNPLNADLNGNIYVNLSRYLGTAGSANSAPMTVQGIASMTPLLANPGTAASWAIGTVASPATNVVTTANPAADPCQTQAQTITPFTVATATTQAIVTGTSAKKIYVCYLYMQTGLANNVAVISGTTAGSCAANVAALVGGTTAAAGLINSANSGQAFGNGGSSVLKTATNNDDICLITTASGPLAGVIKYVVQ